MSLTHLTTNTGERRQFVMRSCLGRGGFGEVYHATMSSGAGLKTEVAVKVLHAEVDPNSQAVQRLRDEGRLLGAVHHPSVLKAYDLVVLDGRVALVFEYVEGQDLDKCLLGTSSLTLRALVEMTGRVSDALQAAWDAPASDGSGPLQLIHRDIKPANIRLGHHGEVKILDFGIARAANVEREARTETNAMLGSYLYMAPERFLEGGESGPGVDVYALGATLYEGIARRRLFGDMALKELYLLILDSARYGGFLRDALGRLPKDVPHQVVALVERMLALEPEKRPTHREVAKLCYDLADKLPGQTLDRWARGRTWPPPRKVRGILDGSTITEGSFSVSAERVRPILDDVAEPLEAAAPETFEGVRDFARSASATLERPGVVMGVGVGLFGIGTGVVGIVVAIFAVVGALYWVQSWLPEFRAPGVAVVEPVVATPEPAPVVEAPRPKPSPVPAPVPVVVAPPPPPAPKVIQVRPPPQPDPEPAPRPAPAPKPAPVVATPATVTTEGGVLVEFRGPQGALRAGRIPPGSYEIYARFAGEWVATGTLYVTPGEAVTVACSNSFRTCEVKH